MSLLPKWIAVLILYTCQLQTLESMKTEKTRTEIENTLKQLLEESTNLVYNKLEALTNKVDAINSRLTRLEDERTGNDIETGSKVETPTGKSTNTYQFSSFGCMSDEISLSCTDERTIFVVDAIFGQYNYPCSDTCCPPHPTDDCLQGVEETRPSDWLALKATCDNQTSCSYTYLGVAINNCTVDCIADYMRIFYTCLPGATDGPVGFSATITHPNGEYDAGELVIFNSVISNFGGHYQSDNSVFICPFDGVYMFSLEILNIPGRLMSAQVYIDNTAYLSPYADNTADVLNHASGTMFEFCSAGSQVWVRTRGNNCAIRGEYKHSSFSAYLLYRNDI